MHIILDTALERDMDLLIMEEFLSDSAFTKLIADAAGIKGDFFISEAIHSRMDSELGESDIVFILSGGGKRHALHIEDKVTAPAMPEQHKRYIQRGRKDIREGLYDSYSVMLLAPQKYIESNSEAQKYEHRLAYEELEAFFSGRTDIRSQYKLALVNKAICEHKKSYQHELDSDMVRFCTAMNDYSREHYPDIPTATHAWWPRYKTPDSSIKLVYKPNFGRADLQFADTDVKELYGKVKDYLSSEMRVAKTGKSASVRIAVPKIDLTDEFELHIPDVDQALKAISELYALSLKMMFK